MARFSRLDVYEAMLSSGLVPIFYYGDTKVAESVVSACLDGGTQVMELTNRGEQALEGIRAPERIPGIDQITGGAGCWLDRRCAYRGAVYCPRRKFYRQPEP